MFLRENKVILSIAQELCLGAVIFKIFRHFLENKRLSTKVILLTSR